MILSTSLSVQVAVRAAGQPLAGMVCGLSRRGIFFRSLTQLPVGTPVQVYILTSKTMGLAIPARIEWQEPGGGHGVLFGTLPPFATALVQHLSADQPLSRISSPALEALTA